MCRCLYKSLPILHGLLSLYEAICGFIRIGMFFATINNNNNNLSNSPSQVQQIPQIVAGFVIDWISSLIPTVMGLFLIFISCGLSYRIIRVCRQNNCHMQQILFSKSIQRFLLFNCNCPCYVARPKLRFLIRSIFLAISLGLRVIATILYATAPTYNNSELSSRIKQLALVCGITIPSTLLILLLNYYHFRVWWYYIPSVDQNSIFRRYAEKHRRFIPYHLMGNNRNEMELWNEPCELQQLCLDRNLEHILIFHFNTFTPTPRWSDIPNRDPLTTTYIGFHRTDPVAAVSIAYTNFNPSRTPPQMLGFGIYFARSIYHTQNKARRAGAIICAEILMGRVLEIESYERNNVSNSDTWHDTFDTIYYRHPTEPLRDEFCIKSNEQILRWVMCIEQQFDAKVQRYGLDTEFTNTRCLCI